MNRFTLLHRTDFGIENFRLIHPYQQRAVLSFMRRSRNYGTKVRRFRQNRKDVGKTKSFHS